MILNQINSAGTGISSSCFLPVSVLSLRLGPLRRRPGLGRFFTLLLPIAHLIVLPLQIFNANAFLFAVV
jgi:hypothetical protein